MLLPAFLAVMLGAQLEPQRFPELMPEDGYRFEVPRDIPELDIRSLDDAMLRQGPRLILRLASDGDPVKLQGVSGLGWTAETTPMRPQNDNLGDQPFSVVPSRPLATPVTFSRVLDTDHSLTDWVQSPRVMGGGGTIVSWRKDVILSRLDRRGQIAQQWFLLGCIPSAYEAMSDIDGEEEDPPLERLTVQCSLVLRDRAV